MKRSLTLTAALFGLVSLSIVAQSMISAPKNLRIVAGSSSPAPKPRPDPGPPCVIPPVGGSAHAYFDALVRRPEHFCNWSLRSQVQLDSLTADKVSRFFTYQFGSDSYPKAQDAAKFVMDRTDAKASVPGTQQLRLPLNQPFQLESGTVLISWDWYWGPEFRDNFGGVTDYKAFQVMMDGHGYWTSMWNLQRGISLGGADASVVATLSDEVRSGYEAKGMLTSEVVSPTGVGAAPQRTFLVKHSKWTRYWMEIKLYQPASAFTEWASAYNGGTSIGPNPGDQTGQGRWHMMSLWVADEDRGPQRLLYRVPFNWGNSERVTGRNGHPTQFRFEMNTSKTDFVGPFVGYGRNAVVLHNYALPASDPEKDTVIFKRPLR